VPHTFLKVIKSFAARVIFCRKFTSAGGPDEWLGIEIVAVNVASHFCDQFLRSRKIPRFNRLEVRKNHSTMFSQDSLILKTTGDEKGLRDRLHC
jgi:hypothetical protein